MPGRKNLSARLDYEFFRWCGNPNSKKEKLEIRRRKLKAT